jgi:Pili and flagellar-assembly chaperone, PapD N-terminal domain
LPRADPISLGVPAPQVIRPFLRIARSNFTILDVRRSVFRPNRFSMQLPQTALKVSTLALAALMLLGGPLAREVKAASLEIDPILVSLTDGETATTIEVTNHGGAPSAIQARIYRWTQAGDDDALTPTHDIIVSPPVFTVPDGGSQTLRLLLRGGIATGGERTYRVLLDEVPPANAQTASRSPSPCASRCRCSSVPLRQRSSGCNGGPSGALRDKSFSPPAIRVLTMTGCVHSR